MYEGYIYVSVDPRATNVASDIQNATTAAYWKKLEHKDDNTQIPDTYGSYKEVKEGDVVVGYTITFPGTTDPINVGKYFATPKVSITNTEGATITELNIGSDANGSVNFSVVGSFDAEDAPEIIVTCEGGWTSSMERNNADNSVTGTITVTPTAVFNSGVVSGKLTVYVTYYGQTSVKQISLKANANVQFNATKRVESKASTVEIPLSSSMIAESAVPSLGFVYEYKDTDEESNIIEAPNVVSNNSAMHGQWIKNNGYADGNISLLVDANVTSKKRAGVVVAYTPDKKTELARFRIIQDAHTPTSADPEIINLADPENNGNYDPANCYVIKTAGRYMIPTFKGNNSTNEGKIDIEGATVKIYNQKNSTIDGWLANTVTRITSLSNGTPIPNDMIVLDIKSVGDIVNTLKDGNAVVAVEKGGATLWSWHLWFNSEFEIIGNSIGSQQDQNYSDTVTMMDRNLGASSATDAGLYYMWGNKNPYFTGIEVGTSTQASKYYGGGSATEAWSDSKTITDPCPPGYKVPNPQVWPETAPVGKDKTSLGSHIYTFSDGVEYPYSGYYDKSLNKVSTKEVESDVYIASLGGGSSDASRYRDIYMTGNITNTIGALWTNTETVALLYGYGAVKISDLSDAKFERFDFSWRTWLLVAWSSWSAWDTKDPPSYADVLGIKTYMAISGSAASVAYDPEGEMDSDYGLPVRCQKITSNN